MLCRLLDKKHSENGRVSGGPAYGSLRSYMPMVTVLKLNSLGKKRFPDRNKKKKEKKKGNTPRGYAQKLMERADANRSNQRKI